MRLWKSMQAAARCSEAFGAVITRVAVVVVLGGGLELRAQATRPPSAPTLGFSAERLERITSAARRSVDSNSLAGAVLLVMRHGKVAYLRSFGWLDREADRRMTPDALFRIASQTKAIVSVGIMMLVEEGRLELRDPVGKYIPEFWRT